MRRWDANWSGSVPTCALVLCGSSNCIWRAAYAFSQLVTNSRARPGPLLKKNLTERLPFWGCIRRLATATFSFFLFRPFFCRHPSGRRRNTSNVPVSYNIIRAAIVGYEYEYTSTSTGLYLLRLYRIRAFSLHVTPIVNVARKSLRSASVNLPAIEFRPLWRDATRRVSSRNRPTTTCLPACLGLASFLPTTSTHRPTQ